MLNLWLLPVGVESATFDLGQADFVLVTEPGLDIAVEHFCATAHRLFNKASRIKLDPLLCECFFRDQNWLGLGLFYLWKVNLVIVLCLHQIWIDFIVAFSTRRAIRLQAFL